MEGEKAEKEELLGLKLKRGIFVGKKGGPCTPVPTWKFDCAQDSKPGSTLPSTVSARKLAANLWEVQDIPFTKMSRGVRVRHQHKDKALLELPNHLADPSHSPPDQQPASASSLRRHLAASLMQHHKSIERNGRALQPVSPASYSSSMEIATYNQAVTPTSSLDFKGRLGESGYNLKTSTELLKVLNRIWSLEEQHASNTSLVKALKMELDHSRARIQQLMQEQQADQNEMDDLLKQVAEEKLIRRSKEQEKIKAAVQSVRDELEDERKLRRRSESLHRKLARELSEVKSAFSKALKELERERKSRILLEDLCDEFARGIGDYEHEVRALKNKSEKDLDGQEDRLILHISEAWLDERMQLKLSEAQCDVAGKNSVVDKLKCEIETFLRTKRSNGSKDDRKEGGLRRHSLESVHLNEAVSAPQDAGDEDSITSDLHCFELNNNIDANGSNDHSKQHGDKVVEDSEEIGKSNARKGKMGFHERIKVRNLSGLQVQFEEQMERANSCNRNKMRHMDRVHGGCLDNIADVARESTNQIEISISQKSENSEAQEGGHDRKIKWDGGTHGSDHVIDNLIRSQSFFSEVSKICHDNDNREDSCGRSSWRGHSAMGARNNALGKGAGLSSPVQQWNYQHTSPDLEISECSSKWPRGLKETTLKAKLLEARLEGQNARLKTSKGP